MRSLGERRRGDQRRVREMRAGAGAARATADRRGYRTEDPGERGAETVGRSGVTRRRS